MAIRRHDPIIEAEFRDVTNAPVSCPWCHQAMVSPMSLCKKCHRWTDQHGQAGYKPIELFDSWELFFYHLIRFFTRE